MTSMARALRWVFVAFAALTSAAAASNPELSVRFGGDGKTVPLTIGKLDIQVTILGDTAHTVVTAEFRNPSKTALEGDFLFDLPRRSAVTGYGLDINGALVEGVLVGERQARITYEKAVRRGIDPGLGEVTHAGAFRTHVFPILPGKGRTVQLSFDTPVDPDKPYLLPLNTAEPVDTVTIHITAAAVSGLHVQGPAGMALAVKRSEKGFAATATAEGKVLKGALSLQPQGTPPLLITRHKSGDVFFEINDVVPPADKAVAAPDHVRLYWDSSLSRRDADLKKEIALVGRFVDAAHPKVLDVVFFAAGVPQIRIFNAPTGADIEALLQVTDYQGGTSLKSLFAADFPKAGQCLFFSDGKVTADSWTTAKPPCPLFAVSSAPDANRPLLSVLAEKSGGTFIDLVSTGPEAALQSLLRQTPGIAGVRASDGSMVDYAVLASEGDRIRLAGKLPDSGDIVVALARSSEASRSYTVNRNAVLDGDAPGSLWALHHIDTMLAGELPDRDAVVAFSRRYAVASPQASFVVFENISDYVDAGVAPPASLGKEAYQAYAQMVASRDAAKAKAEAERLDKIVTLWEAQKRWWVKPEIPKRDKMAGPNALAVMAAPPPPPPPPSNEIGSSVESIVVTGARASDIGSLPDRETAGALQRLPGVALAPETSISVEMTEWKSDRPYIKAMEAAKPENLWYVYREQEKANGTLPAFYLDMAEFLFRHGRKDDAIRIVLNALELPTADTTTMTIVADRLLRYGDTARACWLYQRVLALEPDRPQPMRNLAMALAAEAETTADKAGKIAHYREAAGLYTAIVMHDWNWQYNGIEVISLMEVNRLIAKLKALGVEDVALDKRLVALLDVDLRVVMEWNTDQTDMDLWVDEPTGERAIYSNQKTQIGGRLSNDMTHGYGPEEYLLHRAPNGKYVVRVNVYATDRLNPNGATTVKAHVFRNWGRPNEEEQVLEIELLGKAKDAYVIGTVKVEGSKVKAP